MDDRDQATAAAKQRMSNFRFRPASLSVATTTTSTGSAPPAKSHSRSHSRSNSITTFSLPSSSASNVLLSDDTQESLPSVPGSPSPRSRPNSHHRRRSSVSTRRESAEMMGVAHPPESGSDVASDPFELRRLALWALEGKGRSDNTFIGGFTKVEIPEFDTLNRNVSVDAIQVPKPKSALTTFGIGGSLAGKRDSFGKLLISSSNSLKDQLHTLMEEEEEEEAEGNEATQEASEQVERAHMVEIITPPSSNSADCFQESHYVPPATFFPNRHRPANLTLRPLSLTPGSLPLSRNEAALPTPSPTPSPRIVGLKALTLAPSPSPSPSNSSTSSFSSRRHSLSVSPSPQPPNSNQRHQSMSTFSISTPTRKSSISYKRSNSGPDDSPAGYLPTPGATPTTALPPLHATLPSLPGPSNTIPDLDRPLSPTEQAFLFRSHTSLLSRISDLEQAIVGTRGRLPSGAGVGLHDGTMFSLDDLLERSRSPKRHAPTASISTTSDSDSLVSSQPSNEMLQLVSDLKAERDELMRDVEGWRSRVADMDKQVGTLTRRVEVERRECWVIRERLGLAEVEKKNVQQELEQALLEIRKLEKALETEEGARAIAEADRDVLEKVLKEEQESHEVAEREVEKLHIELAQFRARAEQAEADLQALLVTPKVHMTMQMSTPRRYNSVDSQLSSSSATDVEEYIPLGLKSLKLNAVEEEDEERDLPRDVTSDCDSESDNDELAHYEDDEDLDDDMIFGDDHTSSSFGSVVRSNSHLLRLDLAAIAPTPTPVPAPVSPLHSKTGSIEQGWSFPQNPGKVLPASREPPKVDHFFECLDALDQNDNDESNVLSTYDSATAKTFWSGAIQESGEEDGEMPPFLLPAQPGPPKKEKQWKVIEAAKLEIVSEEAEEIEEMMSFKYLLSPTAPESYTLGVDDMDPVTPRPASTLKLPIVADTPTKLPKLRKTSMDLTIPGFKPYSSSVPTLKAPPSPKRETSPIKVSSTVPFAKNTSEIMQQSIASPTLIPQPTYNSLSVPTLLTPPKSKAALAAPTLIPRLSTSPKTSSTTTTQTTRMPTQLPTPSVPAPKFMASFNSVTTSTSSVFMPQPKQAKKPVTRSSLPPPETPMLTRLSIPQQTPSSAPVAQGMTAKLSQLTSLWSPWGLSSSLTAVPNKAKTRYVDKERQVERLRERLRNNAVRTTTPACGNCRDDVIAI